MGVTGVDLAFFWREAAHVIENGVQFLTRDGEANSGARWDPELEIVPIFHPPIGMISRAARPCRVIHVVRECRARERHRRERNALL